MKKVSIIMPMYNMEAFICDAIESVIAQTYTNWELLITDDCSTDHSVKIVKEYAEKDDRIKLFSTHHNTGGPSEPRNISLSQATGDLVAFLDSDDMWLPCKLCEQVDFMEKNGYTFIYSNVERVSVDGVRSGRIDKRKVKTCYWNMLKVNQIPAGSAMIVREKIMDVRYRPLPMEDFIFWLDILRKGNVAYNCGRTHALYRVRPGSRSGSVVDKIKEYWFVLRNVEHISFACSVVLMFPYLTNGFIRYLR